MTDPLTLAKRKGATFLFGLSSKGIGNRGRVIHRTPPRDWAHGPRVRQAARRS